MASREPGPTKKAPAKKTPAKPKSRPAKAKPGAKAGVKPAVKAAVRSRAKARPPEPPASASSPAPALALDPRVVHALTPHGFPSAPGPGLGFTPADDALFARGYPHMRIVEDAPLDARALARQVEEALDAIDPVLRRRVPRAFAAPYLRGYEVGPLLFVDAHSPPSNARRRALRAEAIASDATPDVAMLERTLRAHGVGMGETYGRWRYAEVLHLYEHFAGSDAVARALTDHLVWLGEHLASWGVAGEDPNRRNAAGHSLALALPWILKRVAPALAAELRARLAAVKPRKQGRMHPQAYYTLLSAIAHPDRPVPPEHAPLALPLALAHDQPAPVREALSRQPAHLTSLPGRIAWLLGTEAFAGPLKIAGVLPEPLLDSVAPLRDPGIVRLVAHVGAQRAGAKQAAAWLTQHAGYVTPILESLAELKDEKERKAARAALALLEGAPVKAAPASEQDLEREIATLFARLGEALRATSQREAQMARIREAHEAYTEARAAAGDPIPEAYFTHRFGDFGLGQWAMLAVDAI